LWQKQSGFAISDDGQRARVTAERLQTIPLFAHLDHALLDTLAQRFVSQNYAEGQTIITAGERGDTFYLIVRGQVEVLASGPGGQQRQVTTMGDGDYFGETAVLEGSMHTTSVRTVTPTLCLALAGEQFLSLLEEAPELRTALEEEIGLRRLRWTGYRRGRAQSLLKALE
jgi:ATP-binding cassette subfamily B protein